MFTSQNPRSLPIYSVEVVTTSPRTSVVTNCGLRIAAHKTFRRVRGEIDTLLIAGGSAIENDEIGPEVVQWIKKVAGGIRRIGSVCTGALLLARAGLLDGRKVTTHWRWCELLAKKCPRADVDPNPIFIRDGSVYTSAGLPQEWTWLWLSWKKTMARGWRCRWLATSCFTCAAPEGSRNLALLYPCNSLTENRCANWSHGCSTT